MKKLIHSRSFYIVCTVAVIAIVVSMMLGIGQREDEEQITNTLEIGPVRELVSVSGIAQAEQSAQLSFPTNGTVSKVLVKKGQQVAAGQLLIELERSASFADRTEASARLSQAIANRDELLSGPTDSAREVTSQSVAQAKETLATLRTTEETKVKNAYKNLLSSGLTVYSDETDEPALPPTVSGSYTCDEEGTYRLEVFSSRAQSGYSYYLTGIESGTEPVSTQQAVALGSCGLRIQFDSNSNYSRTVWKIDIPNTKSANYVPNRNAYALAVTQAESAIANAEQSVSVAEVGAANNNATPRSEAVTRANASIVQAQAQLARVDSVLNDRVLMAPFAGTITSLDILPGETVTSAPVLTLLAQSDFEITARIPEIDIGKIQTGQAVELVFDAKDSETLTGVVDFISLQATEIDGVAYYETRILLDQTPDWIRSGLNADINIVIAESTTNIRIPTRFLIEQETGAYAVLVKDADTLSTTSVQVILRGNDGFVAITGLNEADIIVAP